MKFGSKINAKMEGLGRQNRAFHPILSQNKRFWGVAKIYEKWMQKWVQKATKMEPKITRMPDF